MKNHIVRLIVVIIVLMPVLLFSQEKKGSWEPSVYSGSGYMYDNSGDGIYTYAQLGAMNKVKNHRAGAFASFVWVDVNFNNYTYQAKEWAAGFSYDTWGKVSETRSASFWISPSLKIFNDYGLDHASGTEAWQNDYGCHISTGANLNDKRNRWFGSYKLTAQFQTPFWSKRTGTWIDDGGYLSDRVNFKAVNKTYFKTQFESTAKKIIFPKLQLEPKLVVAYLYDGGSQNSMYEGGTGIAISFVKGERYFEVGSIQYRARFGVEMKNRLDLGELNVDVINLGRLLLPKKKSAIN